MLISVHIPKCAGTSFRRILEVLFGHRLWLNYGSAFHRGQANRHLVPPEASCIHGHFLADAFDQVFPERQLITWVRHPVERVVSNYHHFLRHPDPRDDCCQELHAKKLTLRQFAELDWMRNEATRYLVGKPVAAFACVGIVERFTESLGRFSRLWCLAGPLPSTLMNVNPVRETPRYPLETEEYEHLLALNSLDLQWYNQALAQLESSAGPPAGSGR